MTVLLLPKGWLCDVEAWLQTWRFRPHPDLTRIIWQIVFSTPQESAGHAFDAALAMRSAKKVTTRPNVSISCSISRNHGSMAFMDPATLGCTPGAVYARRAFPARAGFQYPVAKRDEMGVDWESLLKTLERLSFLATEFLTWPSWESILS